MKNIVVTPELAIEKIQNFKIEGKPYFAEVCDIGHICDTLFVSCRRDDGSTLRYVLQRINDNIFPDVDGLMNNIVLVTRHVRKKLLASGGDTERGTMTVIETLDGKSYYRDEIGDSYRVYTFIEDAVNRQKCESVEEFRNVGYAFGNFQKQLFDFDASLLCEVIPNFHNTESRINDFKEALKNDKAGRAKSVADEIKFVLDRESYGTRITSRIKSGEFPLRVTHNDTKLNNLMLDPVTGEGVCVIDLDTIMPGSALYDFGDSIRFGATSAAENEKDLSKVYFRTEMFNACRDGFLLAAGDIMTEAEKTSLADGALVITFETGVRFLGDYLNGDTYFKTHYPDENLDRARNQFKLVADLEEKMASGEIR